MKNLKITAAVAALLFAGSIAFANGHKVSDQPKDNAYGIKSMAADTVQSKKKKTKKIPKTPAPAPSAPAPAPAPTPAPAPRHQ